MTDKNKWPPKWKFRKKKLGTYHFENRWPQLNRICGQIAFSPKKIPFAIRDPKILVICSRSSRLLHNDKYDIARRKIKTIICILFIFYTTLLNSPDESTLPSKNIPPFKCLYEALPESTLPLRIYPLLKISMRPLQNVRFHPRIHPPFKHLRYICDTPRIHPSLPQYTLPFKHLCDPPRIYLSFSEYVPPLLKHLYATLPESTLPPWIDTLFYSHNLPLPPRIYPSFI